MAIFFLSTRSQTLFLSPSLPHANTYFAYSSPLYALLSLGDHRSPDSTKCMQLARTVLCSFLTVLVMNPAKIYHFTLLCQYYNLLYVFFSIFNLRLQPVPITVCPDVALPCDQHSAPQSISHLLHISPFQFSLDFLSFRQNIAPPSHITHGQPVFG